MPPRIENWEDLTPYGMRLGLLQDLGKAFWCVVPAKGWTFPALDVHADGLKRMSFIRTAETGGFFHPAEFDRAGRPRRQPLAGDFHKAGFPDAREIPFDPVAHVTRGRPPARRAGPDPALADIALALTDHVAGTDPSETLRRLMEASVAFARVHGLDPDEAYEAAAEASRPPGP